LADVSDVQTLSPKEHSHFYRLSVSNFWKLYFELIRRRLAIILSIGIIVQVQLDTSIIRDQAKRQDKTRRDVPITKETYVLCEEDWE
jgi:hypothetical protein